MSQKEQNDGAQKGAQEHAEGQHGSKTHSRLLEQLHSGAAGADNEARAEQSAPVEGHHRLYEDREQHDEAEKNSEKNRSEREVARGRHPIDEVRVEGGDRGGHGGR